MSAQQDCAPSRPGGEGARGNTGNETRTKSPGGPHRAQPRLAIHRVRQALAQAAALVDQIDRDMRPDNPKFWTIRYVGEVLCDAGDALDNYEFDLREIEATT